MNRNIGKMIINFLFNQKSIVSSSMIAQSLNISSRKVKYLVEQIEDLFPGLITTSNSGYYIDKKCEARIKQILADSWPYSTSIDREKYMLSNLLTNDIPLNLNKLCSKFFVSYNTLLNEVTLLRKQLVKYNVSIYTKRNMLRMDGAALDKKRILLDSLETELKENPFNITNVQDYIVGIDLSKLKKIVSSEIMKVGFDIDNYSLISYIIHLAVIILFPGDSQSSKKELVCTCWDNQDEKIKQLTEVIFQECKASYPNHQLLMEDIYQISVLMFTRLTPQSLDQSLVSDDSNIDMLNEIIESVNNAYEINLKSNTFISRFGLHLKNLTQRINQKIMIHNGSFINIKEKYPLLFAVAIHVASIINRRHNCVLTEDEISLIALYIGVIREETKNKDRKLNCSVYVSNYYAIREGLISSLKNHFSDAMKIVNVSYEINELLKCENDVDLIISASYIEPFTSIPIIIINPLPTEEDIKQISNCLQNTNMLKAYRIVKNQILHFFHRDIFFTDSCFKDSKEVIEYVCSAMYESEYVSNEFKSDIYDHEAICPSSYGGIAIAHPLKSVSKKSAIAVLIQKQAVKWGHSNVNIVFIFTLAEKDKSLFSDVFSLITKLVNDPERFQSLIDIKDFDAFVSLILKCA